MQIKTAFAFAGLLALVFGIGVALATGVLLGQSQEALRWEQLSADLDKGIFDLTALTGEYTLSQEPRVERQWRGRHKSLGDILNTLPSDNPMAKNLIQDMRQQHQGAAAVFSQLAEMEQRILEHPEQRESLETVKHRVMGSLFSTVQNLSGLSAEMTRRNQEKLLGVFQGFQLVMVLSLGILFALIGTLWWVGRRKIVAPLIEVQKGVLKIGKGQLDFRFPEKGNDEISKIKEVFNRSMADLRRITASRDDLEAEVAARRRAEARLQESAEELRRSNKELEQFAYAASHDLQEPLRAVASYSGLLKRRYEGQMDEKADKYINGANDGALRMQHMIDALLSFSRVTTRGGDFVPISVAEALEEAMKNLGKSIEETGGTVIQGDLPTVLADPDQMVRLFQNLIGNALKFRRTDVLPEIRISAAREDGVWRFDVADNGIGIAEQDFEKVFIIFRRLHAQAEFPGTGLGLSLCQRIVERHGGKMWLDSRLGEGTTFHFTLPGAPDAAPSKDKKEKSHA